MLESNLIFAILIGIISVFSIIYVIRTQMPQLFIGTQDKFTKISSHQNLNPWENERKQVVVSDSLIQSIEEAGIKKKPGNTPLARKFRYARWGISTSLFYGFEIGISLLFFSLASFKFNFLVQLACLSAGPIVMHSLLNRSIRIRFKRFDKDYAQFLMQVVGLLKTGMTAMTAIQTAAMGLEHGSLVKNEVALMLEKVRFGISEDKSIGAFAEDVDHPEIELFVEALLLSRKLGGNLSDTLERLSRQVRKRQFFRGSAEAAIGLQRGSLWIIIIILLALEGYIAILYPELVLRALSLDIGWHAWQVCFVLIGVGIYWIQQVTKFKI